MLFLTPRYAPELVAASLLIATFASYVSLDLAKRVRTPDLAVARSWWAGGSLAMGTGIWAMHFVGMFAYSLPIELGYRSLQTLLSWIAAIGVSAVALALASRGRLSLARLAGGALLMGLGICAMHYIGMAALDMAPGIVWDPRLVAASALIAVLASAAALLIFFWLREFGGSRYRPLYQLAAALAMGLAISGMHYTGMAAAGFPFDSVCLSADQLSGRLLGGLVMLASLGLLSMTLLSSTLDARLQSKALRLSSSLQTANTQLQSANEELRRRAFLDPLTELPNRLLFEDRLQHALARSGRDDPRRDAGERRSERIAVLCIDLDGFKPVNDSLGHAAGDQVLREVARRLQATARDSDTVARIGGDEFVLLMEDVPEIADCISLARRLLEALATPLGLADQPLLPISASIGIAVHPDHGPGDKLMAHADAAMYAAKRAGGNSCALFEQHMDARALEQLSLHTELRQAIAQGQLELHYQPKLDSRRGQIRGVEALLRWRHPQRGLIAPDVFIPIAERFGLISEIGNWVIDEACRQMQLWQQAGLRMRVAINLSVHQLRQSDLVERIATALRRHEIEAAQLLCEITESVAMEDVKTTLRAFGGLGELGVYLAIDDFGTGYSSLSYLRRLPARQLKIDRSFINDLDLSSDARAVVDAVIKLAHALGLSVVAEGVETPAQRDILVALDCDELQGYLFARPMPAQALLDWAAGRDRPEGAADFSPSVFAGLS
ncbi:putative bifunctional diguanylate cyclase/phosphodiesterase [Roseateles violae]|uniref:EAL domain-containing protein n=1 Tax=Roseateles violae TaxID=3058042 RepID=A0ABT8DP22_9BURK|nr:EAL domain-containing protein [Pelomonas sp. PFR6]MDN3919748.1 EAL domain-containing protein [Pelomonas sp. PFR6]